MAWKAGTPGCCSCNCTTTLRLQYALNCPAPGAGVDFYDQTLGGILVYSTSASSSGQYATASYTESIPGHTYNISWSFAGQSGTVSGVAACSTATVDGLTKPAAWTNNCAKALPTLYVTDAWGTYQCWPSQDCIPTPPGYGVDVTEEFVPSGSCVAPTWALVHNSWYHGTGCTLAHPSSPLGSVGLIYGFCLANPINYTGTYPGVPHPKAGTSFNIHE